MDNRNLKSRKYKFSGNLYWNGWAKGQKIELIKRYLKFISKGKFDINEDVYTCSNCYFFGVNARKCPSCGSPRFGEIGNSYEPDANYMFSS